MSFKSGGLVSIDYFGVSLKFFLSSLARLVHVSALTVLDLYHPLKHFSAAPSSAEAPLQGSVTKEDAEKEQSAVETKKQLCPYAAVGECRYGENCAYLHGDACDMCGLQVLHPVDAAQRSQHIKVSRKEACTLTGVC